MSAAPPAHIDLIATIPLPPTQADINRYHAAFAPSLPRSIPITPAQLAAGRAAFKRKRKLIDDLWHAFDCDIDAAVRDIYRSMARAAE